MGTKRSASGRRRPRPDTAREINRRIREQLGEHQYSLLLRRLGAGVKAAQTIAEIAPDLLAVTSGKKRQAKVEWHATVPPDVSMFFSELLATFGESEPAVRMEIERRVLQLVKGNRTERSS